jgi:hypothetical protein
MNKDDFATRWRRLTRGYDVSTEFRMYQLGHYSAGFFTKLRVSLQFQVLPHYFGAPPTWRLLLRKLGGERVLPDFAVVGPIKSGTSDLAVNLMLHPCITTPLAKEFETPDTEAWRLLYPTLREQRRLAKANGSARSGYFPPYLHRIHYIANFAKAVPGAKIILTLRDPVERAYSHWKWEVFLSGKHAVAQLPFLGSYPAFCDRALESFPDYPMYTACGSQLLVTGIYYKAVNVWMDHFGRENVLVLDVGPYFRDRRGVLDRICDFLAIPRTDFSQQPPGKVNENPLKLPPPDEATNAKLTSFYRPYNEKLFALIGERFDWRSSGITPASPGA